MPALQRKVLDYLEAHPDEVFASRDDEVLAKAIGHPNADAVGWASWALQKAGLLPRQKVRGRFYYGGKAAIANLRRRLEKR